MGVEGLSIPVTYVRLYRDGETIPETLSEYLTTDETLLCCQAARHAAGGYPVLLTKENIGCIAAAISLGLVDQNQDYPISSPSRYYTDLMRKQSDKAQYFVPPSPKDFTSGVVYACKDAGRREFGFFGPGDSGRFRTVQTAAKAVKEMAAIQPPTTKGVFLFSNGMNGIEPVPDVIVLSVRPVELTKIIQSYQFMTGESISSRMSPLRVVDSDLIARPYLTQRINVSTYCLGARLLARFEGNRLGVGIPMTLFPTVVQGMKESRTGYPFHRYPGADE